MPEIIAWLIALWALSLVGFPIAAAAGLGRLADRGWTVSRALALLILAWVTWGGGVLGVIPNSAAGIGAMLAALAALAAGLAWRQRAELASFLRRRWTVVVVTEALFLGMFAFWALVIGEAPGINHTEKPMDFGIMNAVINAAQFPPEDQWLSGHSIAYYYGGHYVAAMLTTLTGVPADAGYNLAMATIPATFGAGALGLAYNLLRLAGARASPGPGGGRPDRVGHRIVGQPFRGAGIHLRARTGLERFLGMAGRQGTGTAGGRRRLAARRVLVVVARHADYRHAGRRRRFAGLHDNGVSLFQLPAGGFARPRFRPAVFDVDAGAGAGAAGRAGTAGDAVAEKPPLGVRRAGP